MKRTVYLDNQSTTPVDPNVVEAMLPWFSEKFGNPASSHSFGIEADAAVRVARKQIASLINCEPDELIFTSGTTESINLAHFGIARSYSGKGKHIISTNIEHPAVLESLKILQANGFEVTLLPVNNDGRIVLETLEKSIRKDTILVSICAANNEIGVVQDLEQIGKICFDKNIIFHADAAQAAGKIETDVRKFNIDLLSLSAHKMYGPKGIGALYVNKQKKLRLTPLIFGGSQERSLRPGTLNVPAIVGFGKACAIAAENINNEAIVIAAMRDKLYSLLSNEVKDIKLNGSKNFRLPNNLNLSIPGIIADNLITEAKEVAFSTGSACSSGSEKHSHVLDAIGLEKSVIKSSVRFGIGRFNTDEEIVFAAELLIKKIKEIRQRSPEHILSN